MASMNSGMSVRRVGMQVSALVLLAASSMMLSSCGSFFQCEGKPDCPSTCVASSTVTCPPTGGSGGTGTDFAYVANSATATTDVNEYNLGSGALTAVSGEPQNFDYSPVSMAVTTADTFLYAASDSNISTGNIYAYSIGTGGALTLLGGGPQINENDAALAVSPDGQWLFTLPTAALIINEYSANTTTGALGGLQNSYDLASAPTGSITPVSIAVAPSGKYFAAALATGGANLFPFDTTTGAMPTGQGAVGINPGSAAAGIYAVAFDSTNNLYCAGTAGLQVFSVTPTALTILKTYPLGNAPRSIAINSASTFVYVGNETDSTISAYSIGTGGVLTAVPGSPFAGPTSVNSLAIDTTGTHLIASGYNASTGIQLFSISSTGVLTSVATAGTGTSVLIPGAIAATH
jgi:6-phosphogluconolactonase